jgi:hypothetical protein
MDVNLADIDRPRHREAMEKPALGRISRLSVPLPSLNMFT